MYLPEILILYLGIDYLQELFAEYCSFGRWSLLFHLQDGMTVASLLCFSKDIEQLIQEVWGVGVSLSSSDQTT